MSNLETIEGQKAMVLQKIASLLQLILNEMRNQTAAQQKIANRH